MNKNTCPLCRRAMRLWAFDARQAPTEEMSFICVRTAISFRDECLHTARDFEDRYNALTAQVARGMRTTSKSLLTPRELYEAAAPLFREIEQIKNRFTGLVPKNPMERAA